MNAQRICIVTDELYPMTAGGIGRLVHNLIAASLAERPDLEFHLMVPEYCTIRDERVQSLFGGRVSTSVVSFRTGAQPEGGSLYPAGNASPTNPWQSQSLDFMLALKELESEGTVFDYIEFPDYRGWATCALQEKRLGHSFAKSIISVRLHSSDGVLQYFEPRSLTLQQAELFEIERKALHDADLIVSHLAIIRDFNRELYGFEAEWLSKVAVEFPPVVWPLPKPMKPRQLSPNPDVLFTTKLQAIKGPDLFIRGAATFMRQHPEYQGNAVLMCHSFDVGYRNELLAMIPPELSKRFKFVHGATEIERQQRIGAGIVVVPSVFESLNLAAYEVGSAGRPVVLNGKCPAFGSDSPFRDGVNCYIFDGTSESLAKQLALAWKAKPLAQVDCSFERPYWERPAPLVSSAVHSAANEPLVSVIVVNRDRGSALPDLLASMSASTHRNLEIIVVDDSSANQFERLMLDELERRIGDANVVIHRLPFASGVAHSRMVGLNVARGEFVMFMNSTDLVPPEFIRESVWALLSDSAYSGVVPTIGVFERDEDVSHYQFAEFRTFLGDAPSMAMLGMRSGGRGVIFRRSIFDSVSFRPQAKELIDAELMLQLVTRGHRFIVTNEVAFFTRADTENPEPNEFIPTVRERLSQLSRAYELLPEKLPRYIRPFSLLALAHTVADENAHLSHTIHEMTQNGVAARKDVNNGPLVDRINATIKRSPLLHQAMKRALTFKDMDETVPVRHQLADVLGRPFKRGARRGK